MITVIFHGFIFTKSIWLTTNDNTNLGTKNPANSVDSAFLPKLRVKTKNWLIIQNININLTL